MGDGSQEGGTVSGGGAWGGRVGSPSRVGCPRRPEPPSGRIARYANCADTENATGVSITLTVPMVLLPQLDPGELDLTILGWHADKIAALLYELPRALRRELGDGEIPELARTLAPLLTPFDGPMITALARAVTELSGIDVPETSFRPDAVAAYLRLTCRLVDEGGKVVAQSRETGDLLRQHGARARAAWKSTAPPPAWEKKGLTTWDFGELPAFVVRRVAGTAVRSYPALVDRGTTVDLVLRDELLCGPARLERARRYRHRSDALPDVVEVVARPRERLDALAPARAHARAHARTAERASGVSAVRAARISACNTMSGSAQRGTLRGRRSPTKQARHDGAYVAPATASCVLRNSFFYSCSRPPPPSSRAEALSPRRPTVRVAARHARPPPIRRRAPPARRAAAQTAPPGRSQPARPARLSSVAAPTAAKARGNATTAAARSMSASATRARSRRRTASTRRAPTRRRARPSTRTRTRDSRATRRTSSARTLVLATVTRRAARAPPGSCAASLRAARPPGSPCSRSVTL